MFKLPAKINLITIDAQIDSNCMGSLPGALCVALPLPSSFLQATAHPKHCGSSSHMSCFLCWFALDDALALWLGKDGFFLCLADNVNF